MSIFNAKQKDALNYSINRSLVKIWPRCNNVVDHESKLSEHDKDHLIGLECDYFIIDDIDTWKSTQVEEKDVQP